MLHLAEIMQDYLIASNEENEPLKGAKRKQFIQNYKGIMPPYVNQGEDDITEVEYY
jgi:hypothetical protein